jgi:indole-3-glycerol phosphate synthase
MDILHHIIAKKKVEVASKKQYMDNDFFHFLSDDMERTCYSLKERFVAAKTTGIIAEFKRKSPTKGWIHEGIHISDLIPAYQQYGAMAISILTDLEFFGGETEELKIARLETNIPLLRKDFIIDEFQLYEAKAYGADVILLIAACLTKEEVKQFAATAKNLGMEVLLEIHDLAELDHICTDIDFVGINNRDLKTFEVNIDTSLTLITKIPKDIIAVSESGITDVDTIVMLKEAGFKGFLIGENFMKEKNPAKAFQSFQALLKKKLIKLQKKNKE